MEGSSRTVTRIGHLSSSEKQGKDKKDTTLWQKVCCSTTHQIALSSLWPQPVGKLEAFAAEMENNSTFTKTKDCRQHALVTCVKWALPRRAITGISRFVNRYIFQGLMKTGKFGQTSKLIRTKT